MRLQSYVFFLNWQKSPAKFYQFDSAVPTCRCWLWQLNAGEATPMLEVAPALKGVRAHGQAPAGETHRHVRMPLDSKMCRGGSIGHAQRALPALIHPHSLEDILEARHPMTVGGNDGYVIGMSINNPQHGTHAPQR